CSKWVSRLATTSVTRAIRGDAQQAQVVWEGPRPVTPMFLAAFFAIKIECWFSRTSIASAVLINIPARVGTPPATIVITPAA
ncbi:MAG: hypothetical protein ACUVQS_01680, partial [Candidatus Bipolaricaulaceae bacterium]